MKVERWNFQKGENVLFYIPDDGSNPAKVTARCYTTHEGKLEFELRILEPGIYHFTMPFNCEGKNILIFSEDDVRKLIVIATIRHG